MEWCPWDDLKLRKSLRGARTPLLTTDNSLMAHSTPPRCLLMALCVLISVAAVLQITLTAQPVRHCYHIHLRVASASHSQALLLRHCNACR